jgi:hypothetical protein
MTTAVLATLAARLVFQTSNTIESPIQTPKHRRATHRRRKGSAHLRKRRARQRSAMLTLMDLQIISAMTHGHL